MAKVKIGSDFEAFMDVVAEKARQEGPQAVAELDALHEYYGLVADLIQLRRRRAMTQKELEKATGIPQAEISRIESGNANPTLSTLRTLVRAMGGEIRIQEKAVASSR